MLSKKKGIVHLQRKMISNYKSYVVMVLTNKV